MVFYQIAAGICTGIMIPQFVDQSVYMAIANSFVRPHLRLRMYLAEKNPNSALDTHFLNSYLKDAFGSFILFFFVIGPTIKQAYFPKKVKVDENNVPILEDDKYTQILKKIKAQQAGQQVDQTEENTNNEGQKITFQEYEKLLDELEKQGKLQEMEKSNPKSLLYK